MTQSTLANSSLTLSDGSVLAYTLRSSQQPNASRLVLIHSLALDRSIWDGVAGQLEGDADVLTYDCRGHGQSDRRAVSYTAELFAQDLAELLDHVGWARPLSPAARWAAAWRWRSPGSFRSARPRSD